MAQGAVILGAVLGLIDFILRRDVVPLSGRSRYMPVPLWLENFVGETLGSSYSDYRKRLSDDDVRTRLVHGIAKYVTYMCLGGGRGGENGGRCTWGLLRASGR
jgi:hypothetical protein